MTAPLVRTTVALPADLLQRLDETIRAGKAHSRNALVAAALQHELAALEAAAIDADLLGMANDSEYQAEALALAEEFSHADWEAFRLSEDKP